MLGETPEFTNNIEKWFPWGTVDIYLKVIAGKIVTGKIYSDSLVPELIDDINNELNSKHYSYTHEGLGDLKDVLLFKHQTDSQKSLIINDISEWMTKDI